jgi:arylsulfatase A-like enzyme
VLRYNNIESSDGIILHAVKDRDLLGDDVEDIPEELRRGAGTRKFNDMRIAAKNYQGGLNKLIKDYTLAYLASVAEIDAQIGKILDALEDNPELKKNTIIIFTSDHGWHNGDKQWFYKWSVWEQSTRVPLIIYDPSETFDYSRGKSFDHPVSLIDIYPTLNGLCRLPKVQQGEGAPEIDGHSLVHFMKLLPTGQWEGPDVALSAIRGDGNNPDPYRQHLTVRSKNWRYTLSNRGNEELYDHKKDPYEWENLAYDKEYFEIKKNLKRQLIELLSNTSYTGEKGKRANKDLNFD